MIHKHPVKRGNELSPKDQKQALAAYPYRNTIGNPRRSVGGSRLPPITDEQWLRITDFAVTKDGRLRPGPHDCYTHHDEIPEWKEMINAWAKASDGNVPNVENYSAVAVEQKP